MHIRILTIAVLAASCLGVAAGHAQQPPAANPLDAIPDVMPFDVPYGPPRPRSAIGR
jgi:glc operon protein GlcG